MKKIGIEYILINRAEGLTREIGIEQKAKTMAQANDILRQMAKTAPETGYHKTDFLITWDDGLDYKGTYALKHNSIEAPDLKQHILGNLILLTADIKGYNSILEKRDF